MFPNTVAGFPATSAQWSFAKHCCWQRNFKLSTRVSHGMFKFFIIWFNEEDATLIVWHYRALVSRQHTFASLCFSLHQTCASTNLAIHCRVLSLFVSSSVSHRTMYIRQVAFHSIKYIYRESCPCVRQFSFSIHVPVIFNFSPTKYVYSGNVGVLQWNRKWFFSRWVRLDSGFNVMAINEISCNRPEVILSFRIIPCWVILKKDWRRESVWFSSKITLFFSSVWARIKVDVLRRWSPPETLNVPSATGNKKIATIHRRCHFLCIEPSGVEFWCVHLLQFFNVCDHIVSFPDSRRIQYITEEYACQDTWAELMQSRYVLSQRQGNIRPLHQTVSLVRWRAFRTAFHMVSLPIRQEILNVSQIAVTLLRIRPPFIVQTWLQQYRRCPFFHSAHRSFCRPICFWSVWRWRTMIPG